MRVGPSARASCTGGTASVHVRSALGRRGPAHVTRLRIQGDHDSRWSDGPTDGMLLGGTAGDIAVFSWEGCMGPRRSFAIDRWRFASGAAPHSDVEPAGYPARLAWTDRTMTRLGLARGRRDGFRSAGYHVRPDRGGRAGGLADPARCGTALRFRLISKTALHASDGYLTSQSNWLVRIRCGYQILLVLTRDRNSWWPTTFCSAHW